MTNEERLYGAIQTLEQLAPQCTPELSHALDSVRAELQTVMQESIDFRQLVECIDDSIFVADAAGNVLYVNPAYTRNTNVLPEDVLGRNVFDIVQEGRIFTGGATCEVIRTGQRVFALATTYKTNPPLVGYAVGVPIFDPEGTLSKVVVTSRPLSTLKQLQGDFEQFVHKLEEMRKNAPVSIVVDDNEASFARRRMIGTSKAISFVWTTVNRVAATDATVLITGESGVGKEVVADELYRKSLRVNKPYIKVNCAAIPAPLLESELFGYDRGAFSGANSAGKPGMFELANGGTLLLDEIGDLPLDLQAKLLRAIQNREVTRIGGTKAKHLDIRFIALTNSNLREKVANGTFRSDLFYRLNVIPIQVPPLRARQEDLPELINFFLSVYSEKYNKPVELSAKSMLLLKQYKWPGNIRELENMLEYLTLCCSEDNIIQEDVVNYLIQLNVPPDEAPTAITDLNDALAQYEKLLIEQAVNTTSNLRDAAKILGVNASTISRKMKQYNLKRELDG